MLGFLRFFPIFQVEAIFKEGSTNLISSELAQHKNDQDLLKQEFQVSFLISLCFSLTASLPRFADKAFKIYCISLPDLC